MFDLCNTLEKEKARAIRLHNAKFGRDLHSRRQMHRLEYQALIETRRELECNVTPTDRRTSFEANQHAYIIEAPATNETYRETRILDYAVDPVFRIDQGSLDRWANWRRGIYEL